ncbi:MAG: YceI family protein [Chitinophagales bacterium]
MKSVKKINFAVLIGAFILLSAFTISNAINWQIKDGYSIKFAGSNAEGEFEKINGDIAFDADNLSTSKMSINVDVASIATGNWLKNRHAKTDKWFDADKYSKISFKSSNFSKSENGFIVYGFLEMHGVKKQISIPFTFINHTFKGTFSVNRIDFGIGTLEGMSKKVSNAIKLEISVPVIKE